MHNSKKKIATNRCKFPRTTNQNKRTRGKKFDAQTGFDKRKHDLHNNKKCVAKKGS